MVYPKGLMNNMLNYNFIPPDRFFRENKIYYVENYSLQSGTDFPIAPFSQSICLESKYS